MIWLDHAKRIISDVIGTDASLVILNSAYRDKYVCLECKLNDKTGVHGMVYIVEFNEYGKLTSLRSYSDRCP